MHGTNIFVCLSAFNNGLLVHYVRARALQTHSVNACKEMSVVCSFSSPNGSLAYFTFWTIGCVYVVFLSKFVKSQKDIREQSARMTSKPLFKVKEEMTSLKQMVSALASGLHRNSVAIEALKVDTGKELKHAEISQRTKDTPPGLQYENTAPTE